MEITFLEIELTRRFGNYNNNISERYGKFGTSKQMHTKFFSWAIIKKDRASEELQKKNERIWTV